MQIVVQIVEFYKYNTNYFLIIYCVISLLQTDKMLVEIKYFYLFDDVVIMYQNENNICLLYFW